MQCVGRDGRFDSSQPEVAEECMDLVGDEDIGSLDVAMDKAAFVQIRNGRCSLVELSVECEPRVNSQEYRTHEFSPVRIGILTEIIVQ